jgi:hypothetical protein
MLFENRQRNAQSSKFLRNRLSDTGSLAKFVHGEHLDRSSNMHSRKPSVPTSIRPIPAADCSLISNNWRRFGAL